MKKILNQVFELLCGKHLKSENNGNKDNKDGKEWMKEQSKDYFTEKDIARVLNDLDYQGTK